MYYMILFVLNSRKHKFIDTENRSVVSKAGKSWGRGLTAKQHKGDFLERRKCSYLDFKDGYKLVDFYCLIII